MSDLAATPACLLDDLPVATLVVAASGVIACDNPMSRELLGQDVTGCELKDILPEPCSRPLPVSGVTTWRTEARSADGVPILVDVTAARREDESTVVVVRQVTGSLVLQESVQHLDTAFESAPIGMAFFDTDGRYIRVNRALCELLGRSAEDLLGRRDSDLTHPQDRQSDIDAAWRILRGEIDTWQTEKRFVRPGGELVWAIANMTFLRDDERRPLTWLGQFQDITARKTLEERLRVLADEDPLTGLANRRRLDQVLRKALALAARHGHGGALIYVDLDGFKAVNDTFGHEAGDALLCGASYAMHTRCRPTDTVARVGGDEFAILLPIVSPAQARATEAALQSVLDNVRIAVDGGTIALRATLGTHWFGPDHDLSPDDLIAAADRAMYAARVTARRT